MPAGTLHTWIKRHIAVRRRLERICTGYLLFLMVATTKHSLTEAARFSGLRPSALCHTLAHACPGGYHHAGSALEKASPAVCQGAPPPPRGPLENRDPQRQYAASPGQSAPGKRSVLSMRITIFQGS